MRNTPMDNGEDIDAELTPRHEADDDEAIATPSPLDELSATVADAAFHLRRDLGPGLLESVYERALKQLLLGGDLDVARQQPVPGEFRGLQLDEGFRADLMIEKRLVIELKSPGSPGPSEQDDRLPGPGARAWCFVC